jgi:predicted TIM-barrel fold metal-dependent hydrolase
VATVDKSDRFLIVSSDSHAGANLLAYRPYLASKWHEEFDAWSAAYSDPWVTVDPGVKGRMVGAASGSMVSNWDSGQRIRDLESDGITAEVVFPNTTPPFFPSGNLTAPIPTNREDYERRWAGLQAHNRWLVDFCGEAPGRRAGIAQIFVNDVSDAVEEIHWIKASGLTGGILLPGVSPDSGLPALFSPDYEPIWAACSELEVPINTHSGATGRPINSGTGVAASAVASFESRWWANRAMWHLILAGVFERYANLRFVMTEQGTAWVRDRLSGLDALCAAAQIEGAPWRAFAGAAVDHLSLTPSEYFARNCYLGSSLLLPVEVQKRHEIGVGKIMWGSDYPHSEGPFPYTREALRATFPGVPVDELRLMLGMTAAAVYGFDLDLLTPIAARVGPTVAEISLPLDHAPSIPDESVAHIFMPNMAPL